MRIELTDQYILTSDANNFILNERSIIQSGKNKGKEVTEVVGFFQSIPDVVDGLISRKMRQSKARTLIGLSREHQALIDEIKRMFRTAFGSIDYGVQSCSECGSKPKEVKK